MGTNYYLHINECIYCGKAEEIIHIGKSTYGWCFALHVTDEIRSLDDWIDLFNKPNTTIKNEDGKIVSSMTMINYITCRDTLLNKRKIPTAQELHDNNAVLGPNNLLRCIKNSGHCIGYGSGTWDLIIGDFS